MSDPLLLRITEAIQREHDLVLEMQELASEFTEHVSRMRSATERLQKRLGKGLDDPGVVQLPRILQGGPTRRGSEYETLPADSEPSYEAG